MPTKSLLTLAVLFLLALEVSCRRPEMHPLPERLPSATITKLLFPRGGSTFSKPLTARTVPSTQQSAFRKTAPVSSNAASGDLNSNRQAAKEMADAFLTRDSRNSFIARVYSILSVQMVVTAASVVAFGMNPSLSGWMRHTGLGNAVPILSLLLSTVCWYVMSIKPDARRKAPLKWQLLALFTLGEATSVGFISSFYKLRSVLSAMGATALAASTVSLYTILQKNPKYDLSQWGAGLSSCGLIFLAYGIIQILQAVGILPAGFLPYSDAIYGATGATLFSFYLAYHTKLIVAGKHTKYQMNEKDYVFGAMALYNDIINMFIYVLRLIGEDRDN